MKKFSTALCALALTCALIGPGTVPPALRGVAHAQTAPTLSTSRITFGSTIHDGDCKSVDVTGEVTSIEQSAPAFWFTVSGDTKRLTFCVPKVCLVRDSDSVVFDISGALLEVRAKCSTGTGCATCLGETLPTPRATPPRLATATAAVPTQTLEPGQTAVPTATRTATPVRTATVAPTAQPTSVPPQLGCNDNPTQPIRPTYQDVSLKKERLGRKPYAYDARGCTATQTVMDALQERRWDAAAEAVRMARDTLGTRPRDIASDVEFLGDITKRLGVEYEIARALKDTLGGIWQTDEDGKHYSKEAQVLGNVRGYCLASPVACARSPKMHDGLADAMDVRIVRDPTTNEPLTIEPFADFELPAVEKFNRVRGVLGTVQAKTRMPFPTDAQLLAIDAAHTAHHATDDARCGTGPAQPAGIVDQKHRELEALARNEDEHHFFRMKDFNGYEDSQANGNPNGWTEVEVCKWKRAQGRFHHEWRDAVIAGKWGRSRLAENDHQNAHRCLNLKAGLLVQFSCGQGIDGGEIRPCPDLTCEEWIAGQP